MSIAGLIVFVGICCAIAELWAELFRMPCAWRVGRIRWMLAGRKQRALAWELERRMLAEYKRQAWDAWEQTRARARKLGEPRC
jgi:hypothetical protein